MPYVICNITYGICSALSAYLWIREKAFAPSYAYPIRTVTIFDTLPPTVT
jgi:hypothetical protein